MPKCPENSVPVDSQQGLAEEMQSGSDVTSSMKPAGIPSAGRTLCLLCVVTTFGTSSICVPIEKQNKTMNTYYVPGPMPGAFYIFHLI